MSSLKAFKRGKSLRYVAILLATILATSGIFLFSNFGISKAQAEGESGGSSSVATLALDVKYDTTLGATASVDKQAYALGDKAVLTWKGKADGDDFVIPVSVKRSDGPSISISSINKIDELQTANTEYERRMSQAGTMTEYDTVKKFVEAEHTIDLGQVTADATITVEFAKVAPVYRMYNMITSEHLFTTQKAEYDKFVELGKSDTESWIGEGIDWLAPTTTDNTAIVHRLYNADLGAMGHTSHYYTSDQAEITELCDNWGWVDDGEANQFRSGGTTPIYTCYNEALGSAHHYTSSKSEWEGLAAHGWLLEEDKNGTNPAKTPEGVFQCGIGTSWSFTGNYYTVQHNLESLDGTVYSTDASQTVSGTEGQTTSAAAIDYPGFTRQTIEQQIINGKNTTVVEVKYTRNSYSVNYEVNDSTATAPTTETVKYEGKITEPEAPTATAKVFNGWYWDEGLTKEFDFTTSMPASDLTLYAKWGDASGITDDSGKVELQDPASKKIVTGTVNAKDPSTGEVTAIEGATLTLDDNGNLSVVLPDGTNYDDKAIVVDLKDSEGNAVDKLVTVEDSSNVRGPKKTTDGSVELAGFTGKSDGKGKITLTDPMNSGIELTTQITYLDETGDEQPIEGATVSFNGQGQVQVALPADSTVDYTDKTINVVVNDGTGDHVAQNVTVTDNGSKRGPQKTGLIDNKATFAPFKGKTNDEGTITLTDPTTGKEVTTTVEFDKNLDGTFAAVNDAEVSFSNDGKVVVTVPNKVGETTVAGKDAKVTLDGATGEKTVAFNDTDDTGVVSKRGEQETADGIATFAGGGAAVTDESGIATLVDPVTGEDLVVNVSYDEEGTTKYVEGANVSVDSKGNISIKLPETPELLDKKVTVALPDGSVERTVQLNNPDGTERETKTVESSGQAVFPARAAKTGTNGEATVLDTKLHEEVVVKVESKDAAGTSTQVEGAFVSLTGDEVLSVTMPSETDYSDKTIVLTVTKNSEAYTINTNTVQETISGAVSNRGPKAATGGKVEFAPIKGTTADDGSITLTDPSTGKEVKTTVQLDKNMDSTYSTNLKDAEVSIDKDGNIAVVLPENDGDTTPTFTGGHGIKVTTTEASGTAVQKQVSVTDNGESAPRDTKTTGESDGTAIFDGGNSGVTDSTGKLTLVDPTTGKKVNVDLTFDGGTPTDTTQIALDGAKVTIDKEGKVRIDLPANEDTTKPGKADLVDLTAKISDESGNAFSPAKTVEAYKSTDSTTPREQASGSPADNMTYTWTGTNRGATNSSGEAEIVDPNTGETLVIKILDISAGDSGTGIGSSNVKITVDSEGSIKVSLPTDGSVTGKKVKVTVTKKEDSSAVVGRRVALFDYDSDKKVEKERNAKNTDDQGSVSFASYGVTYYYYDREVAAGEENWQVINDSSLNQEFEIGDKITKPANDPKVEGYTFVGYYKEEELTTEYTFGESITGDVNIYCKMLKNLDFTNVKLESESATFTGEGIEPTIVGLPSSLTKGTDYEVTYTDKDGNAVEKPTNAGVYTVKITGKGDYTGEKEYTFTINPADLSTASVTLASDTQTYDKTEKKPAVATAKFGSNNLTDGTDYDLTHENNVDAGTDTAKAILTGKGNYTGTKEVTFSINQASVTVTGATATKVYDGSTTATVEGTSATITPNYDGSDVAVSTTGEYADKNVGAANKDFKIALTGTRASNYTLASEWQTGGTITAKPITVTGITANEKEVDPDAASETDTVATLAYTGVDISSQVVSGDTVSVAETATGAFADATPAKAKTVTISGISLTGTDAANYSVADDSQKNTTADMFTYRYYVKFNANGGTNPSTAEIPEQSRKVGDSKVADMSGTQLNANQFTNSNETGTFGMKYWTKTSDDVTGADLTGTIPDPAGGDWVRDKSFGDLLTGKIYEAHKTVNLYAQWTDKVLGAYWMAESMKITTGNTADTANVASKYYNNPESSVIKTQSEIKTQVESMRKSDASKTTNETYYTSIMNSDEFHLYTKLTTTQTNEADNYVEFRVINVGAHLATGDGKGTESGKYSDGSVLTFQATHALTSAYQMHNTAGGAASWNDTNVKTQMSSGGTIYSLFNSGLTSEIKTVDKWSATCTAVSGTSATFGISKSDNNGFWLLGYSEYTDQGGVTATDNILYKTNISFAEGDMYAYWKKIGISVANLKSSTYNPALGKMGVSRSGANTINYSDIENNIGKSWQRGPEPYNTNVLKGWSYILQGASGGDIYHSHPQNCSYGVNPAFCF